MKKRIILILILCIVLIGCTKKQEDTKKDWAIDMTDIKQTLTETEKNVFEQAKKTANSNLDYIALLGTQVVSGTNYMFLCKDENKYKIAIVYNDLENVSQITKVTDFDPIKYVNERFESSNETLVGGWHTEIPSKLEILPDTIQDYFDKATETLTGGTYYPIAVLAHEDKSGTNYGILCYSEGSYSGSTIGIAMVTLYVDETSKSEIVSIAAVDLADYNK